MPVMIFLAVSHIGFWGWGIALGLRADTISPEGAIAVAAWLAAIGLWLGYVAGLSRSGWLSNLGVASLPWLWVPSPTVMVSLAGLLLVPTLHDAWFAALAALPAIAVPALHSLRVMAVGTVIKAWRVEFPRRIGFAVGIPDALFGLWSGFIAFTGGFGSQRQELVWNIAGLSILLLMIPMVFTVLRPPRLDAPGKGPARAILAFPMVLAPAGLATLFAILHLISMFRMLS